MSVNISQVKELRDRTNLSISACKEALDKSNGNIEEAIDALKKWGMLKSKEKETKIVADGMVFAKTSQYEKGPIAAIIEVNCATSFCAKSEDFVKFVKGYMHSLVRADAQVETATAITEWQKELIAKTGENIVLRRHHCFDFNADNGHTYYVEEYNHPGNKLATLVVFEVSDPAIKENKTFKEFANNVAMQVIAMSPVVVNPASLSKELTDRQRKVFEGQLIEAKKPEAAWPKIIEGKFAKWHSEVCLLDQEDVVNTEGKKHSIKEALVDVCAKTNAEIKIVEFVSYELGVGIEKPVEDFNEEVSKLIK